MYSNVLRKCVAVAAQVCPKYNFHVNDKLPAKRTSYTTRLVGYVLPKRIYCTLDQNQQADESELKNDEWQAKLEKLLLDPEKYKLKRIVDLELDIKKHSGRRIPDEIKPKHYVQILEEGLSPARRMRYYEFLWLNEKKTENKLTKKLHKIGMYNEYIQSISREDLVYRLYNNSMFLRIYPNTINAFYNSRVVPSLMFGPKLVFDIGLAENMTKLEVANCAKQLLISIIANRVHINPFHLYLCNADRSSLLMENLHRRMPNIYDEEFPMDITSKSYLDLFDKEKLVYLTPHAKTSMEKFDSDKVYIIGAIVDKSNNQPFSLAKAKKEGIKMMKFPLDHYLRWTAGSGKSLTLNQCLDILLDLHITDNWQYSLRHVPVRKLQRAALNPRSGKGYQKKFNKLDGARSWDQDTVDARQTRRISQGKYHTEGNQRAVD